MRDLVQALQETLEHEIPLTRHLELRVVSYDEHGLTLKAPLAPNINHKHTAFAGSLNSLVTLTGWGMLWLLTQELQISARTVIQDSSCRYRRPVSDDFSAYCARPDQEQIEQMAEALTKRGKARIELAVEIHNTSDLAVAFVGRYVIMTSDAS